MNVVQKLLLDQEAEINKLRAEIKAKDKEIARIRDAISGIIGYYSLVSNQNETEKRTIEILGELMTPKP